MILQSISITSLPLLGQIFCHISTMTGQSCYFNFKAVGQIQIELHSYLFDVEKMDMCTRPFFANSVTFSDDRL